MSSGNQYTDEKSLMLELRQGSSAALQYIYDLHYHSIRGYARNLTRDDLQADDIVMDAFLKIWERRERFEDLKGVINFLFIVVRNAGLNFIREKKKRKTAVSEIAYMSDILEADPDTELVRTELIQLAFLNAEDFPKKMKKVFMLIFRDGLSLPQVAKKMGVSVNTVKKHRAIALHSLRRILAKHSFTLFNLFFF